MIRFQFIAWISALSLLQTGFVKSFADEWTNLRGTNTVSAELVGVWNDRAILRLSTGRQIAVKLDDLNAESRIRAQDMQESIEQRLQERITELDAIATEAAAAAPTGSPQPKTAPAYEPPPTDADLQAWLDHLQAQAKAGHFQVYYDSLPQSQKTQAEALFKSAIEKIDAGHWELVRTTLQRAARLVIAKQRWLFSHPKFEAIGEAERESMVKLSMAIEALANPEVTSSQVMRASTLNDALKKIDAAVANFAYDWISQNSLIESMLFPAYQVETDATGKTIAKASLPIVGTLQSMPMVKLEGQWAEGATAEEAQAKWDGYKKTLDAVSTGAVRLSTTQENLLQSIVSLIDKLEAATNRKAFHRVIDEHSKELSAALDAWAGIQNRNSPYNQYEGYDDSMGSSEMQSR